MKNRAVILASVLAFALTPVFLAWNQDVATRFTHQRIVLLVSLASFGILLGQFWLSRLLPRHLVNWKLSQVNRWHKVLGYTAGAVMLLHPILLVARRFWVQESDPLGNLLLTLRSPAMLPALVAWVLLAVIVVLSIIRKSLRAKTWRVVHGALSSAFAIAATWHVLTTGRHANAAMSTFWVLLTLGAVTGWLRTHLPARWTTPTVLDKGNAHETAH